MSGWFVLLAVTVVVLAVLGLVVWALCWSAANGDRWAEHDEEGR